jgi:hypothetical protein
MANLHGAVSGILGSSPLVLPLTIALSAAVMILVASQRPQDANAFLIAILASALVSYYMFIHDMCILLIPIALTLDSLIAGYAKHRRGLMQLGAAALLFAAPSCMSFIPANRFWVVSLPLLAFTLMQFGANVSPRWGRRNPREA